MSCYSRGVNEGDSGAIWEHLTQLKVGHLRDVVCIIWDRKLWQWGEQSKVADYWHVLLQKRGQWRWQWCHLGAPHPAEGWPLAWCSVHNLRQKIVAVEWVVKCSRHMSCYRRDVTVLPSGNTSPSSFYLNLFFQHQFFHSFSQYVPNVLNVYTEVSCLQRSFCFCFVVGLFYCGADVSKWAFKSDF